jgi:hypothetical protein
METGAWKVADGIIAVDVAYVREGAGHALIGASRPTRQLPGGRQRALQPPPWPECAMRARLRGRPRLGPEARAAAAMAVI